MRLICAAHSPLMMVDDLPSADRSAGEGFFDALRRCAQWAQDYEPELVVMFAPDHFNGFFHDLMPSFCIGTEASTTRDWGFPERKLNVPTELAEACIRHVRAQDIDVAVSRRMKCDHGFTVPLLKLFGEMDKPSLLPVFINCAADPRPSFTRVRLLGRAIGAYAKQCGLRTLFIGSGGLSHDPPTPRTGTPEPLPDRVVDRHTPSLEELDRRQGRVIDHAKELVAGRGLILEPDRAWDRDFLDRMMTGDAASFDTCDDAEIDRVAGFGGHEIRTWVAACAAMENFGPYARTLDFYRVIPEWITGMGIMHGWSTESRT